MREIPILVNSAPRMKLKGGEAVGSAPPQTGAISRSNAFSRRRIATRFCPKALGCDEGETHGSKKNSIQPPRGWPPAPAKFALRAFYQECCKLTALDGVQRGARRRAVGSARDSLPRRGRRSKFEASSAERKRGSKERRFPQFLQSNLELRKSGTERRLLQAPFPS